MLSNTHDDAAILWQAKKVAIIAIDALLDMCEQKQYEAYKQGWLDLKQEVELL